jgi:hypothetical protein
MDAAGFRDAELGETTTPSRYRAHVLADVKPTERGLLYRRGEQRFLLEWTRVLRALGAEVGEPEGVRTIVFDLVVAIEGDECVACRFDADPGEAAAALARAVELGVGGERCDAPLRAVAIDGFATRSHPDLESFEEAALEAIRFKPLESR